MRLIGLFLLLLGWQLVFSQSVLNTPITIDVKHQETPDVLREIATKTGVEISFSSSFFKNTRNLTYSFDKESLREVLKIILAQTGLSFKESNGRVLLFKLHPTQYTFSGYIEEEGSGERLVSATVYCPELNKGTVTNEYGFFSISLPQGQYEMNFSYIGYQGRNRILSLNKNIKQRVQLKSNNVLTEVIVRPDSIENPYFVSKSNTYFELSPKLIRLTPSLGGANDPIRSTQMLPSVQSEGDGLGGIHVRGSDNGHNQMLLDGVPVYIPYHLLGVFSVYNPSTVQSAQLLSGKFSAKYGGSLSSVFDVRIREGNRYKWRVEGGVNLTNGQLLVEGPIKKEKTSLLIAGRVNHSDFLFRPMLNKTIFFNPENELYSQYLDLNVKLNHQFSHKDRLYLSYYQGGDIMSAENVIEEDEFNEEVQLALIWSNTIRSIRWNHLFSDKLFSNISLTSSSYDYEYSFLNEFLYLEEEEEEEDELFFYTVNSSNKDNGIRLDFDYLPNPRHTIRFGAGLIDRTFSPGINFITQDSIDIDDLDIDDLNFFDSFIDVPIINVTESYGYFENKIQLRDKWQFNLGLRASSFITEDETYFNLEPRTTLSYHFSPKLEGSISNSRMLQYLHLISSSSLRLPTDLWVPASEDIKPQSAWLTEVNFKYKWSDEINVSLTAYHKSMQHLYVLPDFTSTIELDTEELSEVLLEGSGKSKGIEVLLEYHRDKTGGMASYVFSSSKRTFPTINQQEAFPFEYDARHQFKLFLYHHFGTRLSTSLSWQYSSPSPRRYLQPSELGNTLVTVNIDENTKNTLRSDPYHHLDIDVNYEIKKTKIEHLFKLGAYNIYNRKNTAFYQIVSLNHSDYAKKVSSLSIIPSFSYQIKF